MDILKETGPNAVDSCIAFDLESFGGVPRLHGFCQLGAAHVRADGTVLATFNEHAKQDGFQKEERCMVEFWNKNPELLAEAEKNASEATKTPFEVADAFLAWVGERAAAYPEVYLLTDNPAFDAALVQAFASSSVLYCTGEYRDVVDCGSWYNGLGREYASLEVAGGSSKKAALKALGLDVFPDFGVQHTHRAQDDAVLIAKRWWFVQSALRESRSAPASREKRQRVSGSTTAGGEDVE